ncbi:MAG TPA: hypothetical protein VFB22_06630 [Candidatus Baltobacteraceae bacterium]|nr:hypothetical protein [Candidatus Baltobacteraceae bacterium]
MPSRARECVLKMRRFTRPGAGIVLRTARRFVAVRAGERCRPPDFVMRRRVLGAGTASVAVANAALNTSGNSRYDRRAMRREARIFGRYRRRIAAFSSRRRSRSV